MVGPSRAWGPQQVLLRFSKALLLIGMVVYFCNSCKPEWNFSEYEGIDFLQNFQFDHSSWQADDSIGLFMDFEPVQAVNGLWAGYTEPELGQGLPPEATGPIYRLELKNLVVDGDCELGSVIAPGGFVQVADAALISAGHIGPVDEFSSLANHQGQWLFADISALGSLALVFSPTSITAYEPTANSEYSFGFDYYLAKTDTYYFAFDDEGQKKRHDLARYPLVMPDLDRPYRYPYAKTSAGSYSQTALFNTSDGYDRLRFNPYAQPLLADAATLMPPGWDLQNIKMTLDNFRVVYSDRDMAVRLRLPVQQQGRPDLLAGGTYTLKVWVRSDQSYNYAPRSEARVANRFRGEFFSMGMHDQPVGSRSLNGVQVYAQGMGEEPEMWHNAGTASAWDQWTELSAEFKGILNYWQAAADGTVEVYFAVNNLASASLRSPGSLLLTYPQLYWRPD
jgi:hypothetical protein